MVEVSTRPQKGKTKAAMAVPAAQQAPAHSEGDTLALQAAELLQTMFMAATYTDDGDSRELHNTHVNRADQLICLLIAPELHERDSGDPVEGDIHPHLALISSELEFAADLIEEREIQGMASPVQATYIAIIRHAAEYADRLFSAYSGLPGTLEDLRALGTFAGMRPFRDRPQPPIRRVEQHEAPTNELNREQLVSVLEHVADSASLLDEVLMQISHVDNIAREAINLVSIATFMNRQIGAAADQATGSRIIGDLNDWNCGSGFAKLGKAGEA